MSNRYKVLMFRTYQDYSINEYAPKITIARRHDSTKARRHDSKKARRHENKIARQNEMGEIRTHIGVNHYVPKSSLVEIMKIFIHLVPSCYPSIVRIFGLHAMQETFRWRLINQIFTNGLKLSCNSLSSD